MKRFLLVVLCLTWTLRLCAQTPLNVNGISVRVGPATVVRPYDPLPNHFYDSPFIAMPVTGGYRGFLTYADATQVLFGSSLTSFTQASLGQAVVRNGSGLGFDSQGAWLSSVEPQGGNSLRGWYHAEFQNANQGTTRSMAYTESVNGTLPFSQLGQVISNDSECNGINCGEGDGSVVSWNGYYYMYAQRFDSSGLSTIVARSSDGSPGNWFKFQGNYSLFTPAFDSPGVGGATAALTNQYSDTNLGGRASVWQATNSIMLITNPQGGEAATYANFSSDGVNFTRLGEPLYILGTYVSQGNPMVWMFYPSQLDPGSGGTTWSGSFNLYYIFWPPQGYVDYSYLVVRPVTMTQYTSSIVGPQVGVELSRYYNSALNDSWTTDSPMINSAYTYQMGLGNVLTSPPSGVSSVKLMDCENSGSHKLFANAIETCDSPYVRRQTVGYIYTTSQSNSLPLYQCSSGGMFFASNSANCENNGTQIGLLGYLLGYGPPRLLPQITSLSQQGGTQGTSFDLTISGSSLSGVTSVNFDPQSGITTGTPSGNDTQVIVHVTIGSSATPGPPARSISVTTAEGASNTLPFTVYPTPPAAPSNLSITTVSSTLVGLSWTDNSNNESGFRVQRKTGSGGAWGDLTPDTSANVTTFTDSSVIPSTTYYYRVKAYNFGGASAYSNEVFATTLPSGSTPNSLSLDGNTNTYFGVQNSASINITGVITVEAWIKTNSTNNEQGVLERYLYYSATDGGYAIRLVAGKPRFYTITNGKVYDYVEGPNTVNNGQWHHLAGVFDGAQLRIYVDGTLANSVASTRAPGSGSLPLKIGQGTNMYYPNFWSNWFNGLIDEVRITADVVYTANFAPASYLTPLTNTRGLWKFDGQSTTDWSTNGNNGTLYGTATFSTVVP